MAAPVWPWPCIFDLIGAVCDAKDVGFTPDYRRDSYPAKGQPGKYTRSSWGWLGGIDGQIRFALRAMKPAWVLGFGFASRFRPLVVAGCSALPLHMSPGTKQLKSLGPLRSHHQTRPPLNTSNPLHKRSRWHAAPAQLDLFPGQQAPYPRRALKRRKLRRPRHLK